MDETTYQMLVSEFERRGDTRMLSKLACARRSEREFTGTVDSSISLNQEWDTGDSVTFTVYIDNFRGGALVNELAKCKNVTIIVGTQT